jgi:ribonuclease BN (tRNA processing enzyme)
MALTRGATGLPRNTGNLDLLFLGTGNATSNEGRAHSSFFVNGRYLFDAGPTALQQLKKSRVDPGDVTVILISHFHADHFFGLPFLLLEYWVSGREEELEIVGPPGIEARTEELLDLAFPGLPRLNKGYRRRYTEIDDGFSGEVAGLQFQAFEVEHVPSLRCFGFRTRLAGRTLAYSGDSVVCDGLLKLVTEAEVLVLNCSPGGDPVHLAPGDIKTVIGSAPANATTILSHLDGSGVAAGVANVLVASDLRSFRF